MQHQEEDSDQEEEDPQEEEDTPTADQVDGDLSLAAEVETHSEDLEDQDSPNLASLDPHADQEEDQGQVAAAVPHHLAAQALRKTLSSSSRKAHSGMLLLRRFCPRSSPLIFHSSSGRATPPNQPCSSSGSKAWAWR